MRRILFILPLIAIGCQKHDNKQAPTIIPGASATTVSSLPSATIVVGGQSNALGWGQKQDQQNSPFPTDPNISQVCATSICGPWGPGYEFALDMLKSGKYRHINIIQCAVGGSSIDSWQPGSSNFDSCVTLYRSQSSSKVDAFLWMQGEYEAMSGTMSYVTAWPQKFQNTVSAFRSVIGNNVPLLWSQIGPNIGNQSVNDPVYFTWQAMQQEQEQTYIPKAYMSISSDCGPYEDGWVHFGQYGYRVIGDRMWGNFQGLN